MNVNVTWELIVMLVNGVAGLITIAIFFQKLRSENETLKERITANEKSDEELRKKVESLEVLHTDIKVMDSKFADHRDSLQKAILDLKEAVVSLSQDIKSIVMNQNKLFTEIEVLKKTSSLR